MHAEPNTRLRLNPVCSLHSCRFFVGVAGLAIGNRQSEQKLGVRTRTLDPPQATKKKRCRNHVRCRPAALHEGTGVLDATIDQVALKGGHRLEQQVVLFAGHGLWIAQLRAISHHGIVQIANGQLFGQE